MAVNENSLQRKLAQTRQWWRTTRVMSGIAWALCTIIALALVCYQIDSHLVLAGPARNAWRLLIFAAGFVVVAATVVATFIRKMPDTAVAASVERFYPSLKERLLSTIELAPTLAAGSDSSGFSRQMTISLAEETAKASDGLNFKRSVNTKSLRTANITCAVMIVLLMIQRAAAPQSFDNWLHRMRNPQADIPVWANTRVWVTPEHDLVPVGESDKVGIVTRGTAASNCTLFYRPSGDKNGVWKTAQLTNPTPKWDTPASKGEEAGSRSSKPDALQFNWKLPTLSTSVEMYAKANDGRSNDKTITVEARPTLLNVKLTLHYPTYMHRVALVIPTSNGGIGAPAGTEVDFEATANKPLKTAILSRDSRETGPLAVTGSVTRGHVAVSKDGSYSIALTDKHDFANAAPVPNYEIHAIQDLAPTVQISRPTTDIDLVPDGSVPLVAHAADDYAVTGVRLQYLRTQTDAMSRTGAASQRKIGEGSLPLPLAAASAQINISERWNLTSVHGKPGDTVRYEVDAVDNDTLNGPHIGRSNSLTIHFVSVLEMQRKLKDNLDEEARAVDQLRKNQIEAQKQLMKAKAKMDPTALAHAQEAQRSVAEEAKAITQRVADVSAQLENNNLATKSELDRRNQAEETLKAVGQQKAPDAADAVQKAQTSKAGKDTKAQAVAHAEKAQNDIRKDIEKTQDLLSRTASADQLAAEAKRLATEQERLADTARSISEGIKEQKQQTGNNTLSPELKIGIETEKQQQKQANEDTKRLQKQLNEAAKAAQERGQQKQADALKAASDALQKSQVASQQAQASQNLDASHPEKAAPQQDRAAAGLEKAAQQAQQAANADPNASNAAEQLEKTAAQLRDLAKQQRDVADKAGHNPNSQQIKDLAKQEKQIADQANQAQQNLNASQNAQQSLQQAQQNLSQAGKQLSQNQSQKAQSPANKAAQNLDNAAKQADNAAQQLRQQQAAAELADKVDRLAQIQAALKNQTERLHNASAQRPLTQNEKAELGQVAARQQNVEEEAKTLAERFPSPSFQKALQNAAKQAHPATQNLNPANSLQPDTGLQTQVAQIKAAQTLAAVAQALKQQAQASKDQQQSQNQQDPSQQPSPQQAQQAEALGELLLAQGLQQQVRQNTAQLDQTRKNQPLTSAQQEDAKALAQDQQDAKDITDRAADALSEIQGVPEALKNATQHMDQSHTGLNQQQTGQPIQGHQDTALQSLAQAQQKAQQAMQQQQQQQQAQQQGKQGAPQPSKQPGAKPDTNAFTRLEGPGANGARSAPLQSSGNFANLSDRSQRTLREGRQEKVPAEYQDLVSRYYKSLSDKKR